MEPTVIDSQKFYMWIISFQLIAKTQHVRDMGSVCLELVSAEKDGGEEVVPRLTMMKDCVSQIVLEMESLIWTCKSAPAIQDSQEKHVQKVKFFQ